MYGREDQWLIQKASVLLQVQLEVLKSKENFITKADEQLYPKQEET